MHFIPVNLNPNVSGKNLLRNRIKQDNRRPRKVRSTGMAEHSSGIIEFLMSTCTHRLARVLTVYMGKITRLLQTTRLLRGQQIYVVMIVLDNMKIRLVKEMVANNSITASTDRGC